MATNRDLKKSLDEGLLSIRNTTSRLRLLVWRHGATADPRVLLQGLDELFEASVELEVLLNRERLSRKAPDPDGNSDGKHKAPQTTSRPARRKALVLRP